MRNLSAGTSFFLSVVAVCFLIGYIYIWQTTQEATEIKTVSDCQDTEPLAKLPNKYLVSEDFKLITFLDKSAKEAGFRIDEFNEKQIEHRSGLSEVEQAIVIRSVSQGKFDRFLESMVFHGTNPMFIKDLQIKALGGGVIKAQLTVSVFKMPDAGRSKLVAGGTVSDPRLGLKHPIAILPPDPDDPVFGGVWDGVEQRHCEAHDDCQSTYGEGWYCHSGHVCKKSRQR